MQSTQHILDNLDKAIDDLAERFVAKYFGTDDYFWISGDHTGVLSVNDYFFDLNRVYEAIKFNCPKKKFFDYYDLELDRHEKNEPMNTNFENYIKYGIK
jgi:hypothetical protein